MINKRNYINSFNRLIFGNFAHEKLKGLDLLEVQAFSWELNRTIGKQGLS
jgi:hypothetical protein